MNFTKVVCVKTPIDYFWEMKVLLYAWDHFDEWVILQRLLDVENESIITNAGHLIHWPLIALNGSCATQFKRPWFTLFHMFPYNIYSVETPVLQCNVTVAWWRAQYSRGFVCECTASGLCL